MNKNTDNYHYGYEQEKDQVETITNKLNVLSKHERLSSPLPVQPSLNDHCHEYSTVSSNIDKSARRKLILASGLCLFFMTGEIIGGALAHSLAIMTDTAHLLTDFASFLISLLALFLASRPSTKRMSFGWHRAEVVGALASVLLIWLVTGILVYLAVIRIIHNNYEINGKIMLITSATGVGVNIISLMDIPGVREIHNLHMWSLTTNKTAVSVHLAIENDSNTQEILKQANYLLKQRYLAHDVTIQLELYVEEMANCYQCKEPLK
ncbi:cation efflux protein/ zinc transporter,putative [Schistosoma mansoni]|uniref:cation efflux protein/ zinc transporter,putative n=1 Tax=Schistosoma mansoni TaxID=6183 RepID=UPI00022C822C|nr:cation efflux protein/ zinc transporter,putative [Schistosoma mansoni]|eukprot:XP_018647400.1 cation efflux protein/ zinc transporter,putative [Schistosoma mansoni]